MAKKKEKFVVYSTANEVTQDISKVQESLNQIPAYSDSGVKYEGKFKKQTGNYEYQVKNQAKFYIENNYTGGGTGEDYLYCGNKKIFLTGISYSYRFTNVNNSNGAVIQLSSDDAGTSVTTTKFWLRFPLSTGAGFIDYSSAPVEINPTKDYPYLQFILINMLSAAADVITVQWFGFSEEI